MKVNTRKLSVAVLSVVCGLALLLGVCLFSNSAYDTYADSTPTPTATYYGDNLLNEKGEKYELAETFYDIIDELNTTGDFKDGVVNYKLDEVLSSDQIKAWVIDGNLDIPKAFGAARDTYFYDHPELFYVDLYKLSISAVRSSGEYKAYIDCGREADCYFDRGIFANEAQVEAAIAEYDAALKVAYDYAVAEADKNTLDDARDMLLARYANQYLAQNVVYDYDALEYINENNDYEAPYIGNAYGALVQKKCVCRGYSFAFKAILDKMEIPCIIVSGYSTGKNTDGKDVEQGEAHSWNYVWLANPADQDPAAPEVKAVALSDEPTNGSAWYAFDVTWNAARKDVDVNGYTNMNAFTTGRNHVADPVIASSGYKLRYPELSMMNYGNRIVDNDFVHSYIYKPQGNDKDDFGNQLYMFEEYVGYKGAGALELSNRAENKLYILHHAAYFDTKTGELTWQPWYSVSEAIKSMEQTPEIYETNGLTRVINYTEAIYSQFAVVDIAPNSKSVPGVGEWQKECYYTQDVELGEHMLYISQVYTNKAFGNYTAAPYIKKTTPKHTEMLIIGDYMKGDDGMMADKYAFEMKVEYDEELHVLDESKPIGVEYVTEFANIYQHSAFVPYPDGSIVKLLEDKHTLMFKFKPSLMYEHNSILYSFMFTNVGSAKLVMRKGNDGTLTLTTSNKLPNPVHHHFAREAIACSRCLGGGRLWVDCCAQPTLVSNSDLAAMDFKDPDGNSTFSEEARSQMMLVVNTVKPETETEILENIDKNFGIKEKDVKASETYDINLQICGKYPKIPDNSYVKIALGFPQGYGPEDQGVTFKLYHRKHISGDEYIIEEIPCVVTQFGIVATVSSFSPYTVVAVDASKASTDKNVYATIDGKGGTLSKEDGQIRTLQPNQSYTYTFTPATGYEIFNVTLNGADVTQRVGADGKLTLTYDELLNNNEVTVQYISTAAAQRYSAKNLEVVNPVKVIVNTEGEASIALNPNELAINNIVPPTVNNTAIIVSICIIGAALLISCVAVIIIAKRNKSSD